VPVIAALVGAAALLLLAAGAAKAADPSRTAGALAVMGWPASPVLVRAGAVGEAVVGAAALVVGGWFVLALVALSYAAFTVFVVAALRSGAPVGTCGCFGQPDTPPRVRHAVVDGTLAVAAGVGVVVGVEPVVEARPAVAVGAALVAVAGYVALTRRSGVSDAEISA
jgi:hypothetical protein